MQETQESWAVLAESCLAVLAAPGGVQWGCWGLLGCHVSPSFGAVGCFRHREAAPHDSAPHLGAGIQE